MDVWSWSSPIALGLFVLMMAGTLVLLATAVRVLATMPVPSSSRNANTATTPSTTTRRRAAARRR